MVRPPTTWGFMPRTLPCRPDSWYAAGNIGVDYETGYPDRFNVTNACAKERLGAKMADIVNRETRSRMMSSVRSKNTKPEMEIRRRLFGLGYRYGLHNRNLPGAPDMVLPKYRSVVFINGCFWHHHGCHLSSIPETRRTWWKAKLEGNCKRDSMAVSELQRLRWRVLIIWECAFRKPKGDREKALNVVLTRTTNFLNSKRRKLEIPLLEARRGGSQN